MPQPARKRHSRRSTHQIRLPVCPQSAELGDIATRRGALDEAVHLHQPYGHRNQLPWVAIALSGAMVRQGRVTGAAVIVTSADSTADRLGLVEDPAGDAPESERMMTMIAERAGDRLANWSARKGDAAGRSAYASHSTRRRHGRTPRHPDARALTTMKSSPPTSRPFARTFVPRAASVAISAWATP
jgi:hypothetical protein